jgi:hypothetical protein
MERLPVSVLDCTVLQRAANVIQCRYSLTLVSRSLHI